MSAPRSPEDKADREAEAWVRQNSDYRLPDVRRGRNAKTYTVDSTPSGGVESATRLMITPSPGPPINGPRLESSLVGSTKRSDPKSLILHNAPTTTLSA